MMNNRRTTHTVALVLLVIMVLPPPMARAQTAARSENAVGASASIEQLNLLVGRSVVIRTDRPITRVSLSTPDIADALVTTPYELLVHGKAPGTISLLVWSDNGKIKTYDVAVRRDLSALDDQMHKLFPHEAISVASNGKDVVLSGTVSTKYIVDKASMLAVGYVDKPENVVNLMQQQEGVVTDQILLRVRFAEISRNAVQQLGASFFTGANGKGNWIARSTTQQFAAPTFDGASPAKLVFSDFLNLFAFNTEAQIGTLVQAMKSKGLFQSLAEPNLVTTDGKEASFLAGGEYPYPVLQGAGSNSGVTIVFKEFGVRLKFTPTVLAGGMIHLKVLPEVSTLDFGNAIVIQGFRVPSLTTRRTETEVELRDGQTFAIAGLLDHTVNDTLRKVPGIGDIPILGYLFKSQAYNKDSTELVVMITPHILRRDSPGVTPNLPGIDEPYLGTPNRTMPQPPAAFTGPQAQQQAQPKSVVEAPVVEAPPAHSVAVPAAVQSVPAPVAAAQPATSAADERQIAQKAAKDLQKQLEAERALVDQQRKQNELQRKQDEARARASATVAAAAAKVEAASAEQQRKQDAVSAEQQRKQDAASAELQRKQDAVRAEADAAAAKVDAALAEQQSRKDAEAAREELKKLNLAQKDAEKRAAEQGVIDRKRMVEQQAEAARVKEAADKLAKEKAKLDKEQADREAELAQLIAQYQKLTGTQATVAR
jgi:pilus assembly protein CpaC